MGFSHSEDLSERVMAMVPEPWVDSQSAPEEFVSLTAEQAQRLQAAMRPISLAGVWWGQLLLAGAMGVGVFFLRPAWFSSVCWGAFLVLLPQALMVAMVGRNIGRWPAAVWLTRLFVWEWAKFALTLGLLAVAARWVQGLVWPVLLVAFVLTLKMGWLAAFLQHGCGSWRPRSDNTR